MLVSGIEGLKWEAEEISLTEEIQPARLFEEVRRQGNSWKCGLEAATRPYASDWKHIVGAERKREERHVASECHEASKSIEPTELASALQFLPKFFNLFPFFGDLT